MIVSGFILAFTWSAVHAILAAAILVGGSVFWVLHKIHTRLSELEEKTGKRKTAIFGSEDNPLHVGLTKEVSALKKEVDELREELEEETENSEELERRLNKVERKIERILDQLDD